LGHRTWVKIYTEKWITGSIRQDPPEVRGVFVDLIALAGDSRYGDIGEIKVSDRMGFSDAQICDMINVSIDTWLRIKEGLAQKNRISVDTNNIVKVVNFLNYQSEYERVKKYTRQTTKINTNKNTQDSPSLSLSLSSSNLYRAEDVMADYNAICGGVLPKVIELTTKRMDKCKVRLEEKPDRAFWIKTFTKMKESDFLTGKVNGEGHENWIANFDWIIKNSDNCLKVMEGVYDNKKVDNGSKQQKESAKDEKPLFWLRIEALQRYTCRNPDCLNEIKAGEKMWVLSRMSTTGHVSVDAETPLVCEKCKKENDEKLKELVSKITEEIGV
jgi:hypothetical protein